MHFLVSIGTEGASPQIGEVLPPCDFLTVLSCPYLFFSILRPVRNAEPIFTFYGSNDVFPCKDGPFWGLERWVTIFGEICPQNSPRTSVRQFIAKTAKYKNRNISKTINRVKTKFEDQAETDNCTSWVV